jgi:hypothetical protein
MHTAREMEIKTDVQRQAGLSPSVGHPRKFTRSGRMIGCLREHFVYSEKRARDFVFDAVEGLLPDYNGIILSRLAREAITRARRSGQNAGYEFTAWDTAGQAVVNSMLYAGVFLTHDRSPIYPGVAAQATEVVLLKDGHRDLTECYLLELLIRKLGDVTTRDHTALAHALFRQFDPRVAMGDLQDRVVLLLARMSDRIVLFEDGVYAVVLGNQSLRS